MGAGAPATPTRTTTSVNSARYYASGALLTPPSGTGGPGGSDPSLSAGPWKIEGQGLEITYVRVPEVGDVSSTLNLSSFTSAGGILGTKLLVYVNAFYHRVKSTSLFPSGNATFQQPQQFEFMSVSADNTGMSYGELSAGTALGAAGGIVTVTPFASRSPWIEGTDTSASEYMNGANFWVEELPASGTTSGANVCTEIDRTHVDKSSPQTVWMNRFKNWAFTSPTQPGSVLLCGEKHGESDILYPLNGAYTTGQETIQQIVSLIDTIGTKIKNSDFIAIPPNTLATFPPYMLRDQGFGEYDITRHDYSG